MRLRALALVSVLIFVLVSSMFVTTVEGAPSHVPAPRHNWIEQLSPYWKARMECVIWRESRSTLQAINVTDNNPYGSSGVFQIEQSTWASYQLAVHVPYKVHVWQASVSQQFAVAHVIYLADGLSPWHPYDGC